MYLSRTLGGGLQQANGLEQEVVEVEGVGFEELLLVDLEDVGDFLFDGVGAREEVLLRVDHVVLRPADSSQRDSGLESLVVDGEPLECWLDYGLLIGLVIDGEVAGEAYSVDAKGFDVAAEDSHAEAMEGCEQGFGERGVAENFVDSLGHLLCGLVGEGDGEDGVRGHASFLDEVCDAVRDNASLSGPCACKQKDGAIDRLDAFLLLRIHVF